jgi:hypothetical protein
MQTRSARRNFQFDEKIAQKINPAKRKSSRPVWKSLDQEMKEPKDLPPPATFNRLIHLEHKKRHETVSILSCFLIPDIVDIINSYYPAIPRRIDTTSPMWHSSDERILKRTVTVPSDVRKKMNFLFHLNRWCREPELLHLHDFHLDDIFPSKYYVSLINDTAVCILQFDDDGDAHVNLLYDPKPVSGLPGYRFELSDHSSLHVVRHDLFRLYQDGRVVTAAATFAELVNFVMAME